MARPFISKISPRAYFVALAALMALCLALAGCSNGKTSAKTSTPKAGYETATAADVEKALSEKSAIVVDARNQAAWAGWKTADNTVKGHIQGATDFSANWLTCTYDDKENLEEMTRDEVLALYLEQRGIKADSSVIIYDENGKDAKAVADFMKSKGIKDIKTFDAKQWKGATASYKNYTMWIPANVLNDIITGKPVAELPDMKNPIIVDARWGSEKESGYLDGHIPGAIHVNSDDFDNEDKAYILDKDSTLLKLAASEGITKDSTVILTGDPIFSARYATILKYLGVKNVYIMGGTFTTWTDAGYELEKDAQKATAVDSFGADKPLNPDFIDTVDEAEKMVKDSSVQLVDTRTVEEFEGKTSGYSYFKPKGRIDGSVLSPAGIKNSSSMLYYRNIDGTMRNGDLIEAMWKKQGVDTAKHLSFFCGGGYRAGEILWDAQVLGHDNTSIFSDGWCGWALAGKPSVSGK